MPKVHLPDGRVVHFPNGMGPQEIEAAISGLVGEPPIPDPIKPILTTEGPYSGAVLPMSKDAAGNVGFDINAGITGVLKRALMAPGDAVQGKLDPTTPEGMDRTMEAAAVMTPLSAAAKAGEKLIPGTVKAARERASVKTPTAAALKEASKAGYNRAADLGVDYSSVAVKSFADDAAKFLDEEGFIAELGPKTHAIINKLRTPPEGSTASLKSLDAFRKQLNRIGGSPDPTEAAAATVVIRRLDEFLQKNDPANLVAGTYAAAHAAPANVPRIGGAVGPSAEEIAKEAARVLAEARGNAAASFRSDRLTGVADAAELRAAAANSGKNLGNQTRQRLASLLLSPKKSRGFSPDEIAALEEVVRGTATENTLRKVSNMLGGGGGIGQSLIAALGAGAGGVAGGVPGGVVGAVVPAMAGSGTRSLANMLTKRHLGEVDKMVRARSPLAQQLMRDAPTHAPTPDMTMILLRSLLANARPQTPPDATQLYKTGWR